MIRRNIPNFITCLNIASGMAAILMASRGDSELWGMAAWRWACLMIGIAAVADFCDGFAARLLHAYSDLGKELDSLCDLVSFGVAPAFILYNALPGGITESWASWTLILIPVGGALRLARFNIDTRQTTSFIGLPIPANAIFWIGYTAMLYGGTEFLGNQWIVAFASLCLAWLMNSPVRLFSLKFKTFGLKGNVHRWLLIAAAVIFVALMGLPGLLSLIIFYLLLSLLVPSGNS